MTKEERKERDTLIEVEGNKTEEGRLKIKEIKECKLDVLGDKILTGLSVLLLGVVGYNAKRYAPLNELAIIDYIVLALIALGIGGLSIYHLIDTKSLIHNLEEEVLSKGKRNN